MEYKVRVSKTKAIFEAMLLIAVGITTLWLADNAFLYAGAVITIALPLMSWCSTDFSTELTICENGINYSSKQKKIAIEWKDISRIRYNVGRCPEMIIYLNKQHKRETLSLYDLKANFLSFRLIKALKKYSKKDDIVLYNKYNIYFP
jgi:hypothetical protein